MRQTTSARFPAPSRPDSAPARRRPTTLSEIERHELRVLESSDHSDDERTNPWFPPTGPSPARR